MSCVGGGAKSALWRQMVADIFNCEVVSPVCEEAGALGAALQAAWCFHGRQENDIPLQEITDRCVSLDRDKSASPSPDRVRHYSHLYE